MKNESILKDDFTIQEDSVNKSLMPTLTYEQFRSKYDNIQGNLYGASERNVTDLDWTDVAAKYDADEELKNVRNVFQLVRRYEQKYSQKW